MIYLITINYNSSQFTRDFLDSLNKVKTDFRLIIVDNCSTNDDFISLKDYLESSFLNKFLYYIQKHIIEDSKKYLLVREERNLGFAGGNNIGIEIAKFQPDFEGVILINNDTVVAPDFLDEIIKFRKHNNVADLIGCRIFYDDPPNKIWYDGGKFYKHSTRAVHINENKSIDKVQCPNLPKRTDFITGCFMYISKHCIDKIGMLDESLFMYNEDLEYCIRAQKDGILLYHLPTAVIWHKISLRSGRNVSVFSTYWGARNRFVVSKKHSNLVDRVYTFLFYVVTRIPRFLIWLINGRTDLIKAQTKGMIDGIKKEI